MEPTNDKRISEHVLRMHRYRNPGEQDGEGEAPHGDGGDIGETIDNRNVSFNNGMVMVTLEMMVISIMFSSCPHWRGFRYPSNRQ